MPIQSSYGLFIAPPQYRDITSFDVQLAYPPPHVASIPGIYAEPLPAPSGTVSRHINFDTLPISNDAGIGQEVREFYNNGATLGEGGTGQQDFRLSFSNYFGYAPTFGSSTTHPLAITNAPNQEEPPVIGVMPPLDWTSSPDAGSDPFDFWINSVDGITSLTIRYAYLLAGSGEVHLEMWTGLNHTGTLIQSVQLTQTADFFAAGMEWISLNLASFTGAGIAKSLRFVDVFGGSWYDHVVAIDHMTLQVKLP